MFSTHWGLHWPPRHKSGAVQSELYVQGVPDGGGVSLSQAKKQSDGISAANAKAMRFVFMRVSVVESGVESRRGDYATGTSEIKSERASNFGWIWLSPSIGANEVIRVVLLKNGLAWRSYSWRFAVRTKCSRMAATLDSCRT